jgi:large subunit ribosomal protein L18
MLRSTDNKIKTNFLRRQKRIRYKLKKENNKPRLCVFVSNLHIYAQVIDDVKGITLASSSTLDKELRSSLSKTSNKMAAEIIGKSVAQRLIAKGISEVVFDRGGRLYHGKIKSLADSARESGLKF